MSMKSLRRALVLALVFAVPSVAGAAVTVKGKLIGTESLLNPVWNEAKDPKEARYSFREPSPAVPPKLRELRGHLPKELCIAVLADEGKAEKVPLRMIVAGGRTTPVTLVVAPGQQIQFENADPFPHDLFETNKKGGFPEGKMAEKGSVNWTPPAPGTYEIRDRLMPSVRSWVVVEPKVLTVAYPNRKGEFKLSLEPGTYSLRGYHNGAPVGDALPLDVKPAPAEQLLQNPLKVGKVPEKKKEGDEKKPAEDQGGQ